MLEVTVKPGAKVQKVVENPDGSFVVYCHARAHDGESNAAVIELLANHLGVAKSALKIIRGAKSRHKLIS